MSNNKSSKQSTTVVKRGHSESAGAPRRRRHGGGGTAQFATLGTRACKQRVNPQPGPLATRQHGSDDAALPDSADMPGDARRQGLPRLRGGWAAAAAPQACTQQRLAHVPPACSFKHILCVYHRGKPGAIARLVAHASTLWTPLCGRGGCCRVANGGDGCMAVMDAPRTSFGPRMTWR